MLVSLNDRCHEALFALRSGTPLEDTPAVPAGWQMLSVRRV